jgi:hypothetical protein
LTQSKDLSLQRFYLLLILSHSRLTGEENKMSVYKEGWHAVQTIGGNQTRIWPDAADYGVPFKKGDRFWIAAKTAAHFYGDEATRKVKTYLTGKTASIELELMDEFGQTPAKTTKFRLTVVLTENGIKTRQGKFDGYMEIEELTSWVKPQELGSWEHDYARGL